MPITFSSAVNLRGLPVQNIAIQQGASNPVTGVLGQLFYNTAGSILYVCTNATGPVWTAVGSGAGGPPSGTVGGIDIGGSYPNSLTINGNAVTYAKIQTMAAATLLGNSSGATATPGAVSLAADLGFNAGQVTVAAWTAGDLTKAAGNTTPTINNNVVTLAKLNTNVKTALDGGSAGNTAPALRQLGTSTDMALPGNTPLNLMVKANASLDLNTQKIVNLVDPTGAQDAATKNYVDGIAQGLDAKQSVRAASTGSNLPLSGTAALDGVAIAVNDRVLVKDQTTPPANGIYIVAAGSWTRAPDMDVWAEVPSAFVFVEQGTALADTGWVCTADQGGTLGTTNITWTQFSGAGAILGGAGLVKTGQVIDLVAGDTSLTVNADEVHVNTAVIATVASLASYVPTSRTLSNGTGITGGGDLSANRTLAVDTTVIAPLASPTFTGTVTVPTPGVGTSAATKTYVDNAIAGVPQGTVKKAVVNLPVVSTAGTGVDVIHNLGSYDVQVMFLAGAVGSTSGAQEFMAWNVKDNNTITVTADLTIPANTYRCVIET